MSRSLLVHVLVFVYLSAIISLLLSCYREEAVPAILRETARRTAKLIVGVALLAGITFGVEHFFVD